MWQRFTERARRIILLAQEAAGQMESGHVGTEHLLIGLTRESEGVAAQILAKMGVSTENVRAQLQTLAPPVTEPTTGEPKLTSKAKRTLELAADEARRMRHSYIGTEHLLLALLRDKDGLAAAILRNLGLNLDTTRTQVLAQLGPDAPSKDAPALSVTPTATPFSVSPALRATLEIAARQNREAGRERIEIGDLLRALCEDETAPILRALGIDVENLGKLLK